MKELQKAPTGFVPKRAVYTPAEVSKAGLQAVQKIQKTQGRGAILDIADIKEYFAPLLPGQVCAVLAQTSNYKSGFMHFWERSLAEQLQREGRTDEAIIHVSVEEIIEEQAYLYFARETGIDAGRIARGDIQDWSKLEAVSLKVGIIPIYRIGDSLARADEAYELHLSNMLRAIKSLTSGEVTGHPVKPAAIFFDYLQAFPYDPDVKRAPMDAQRRLQVREDIYRLRLATTTFDCPIVVGVQAKQHLEGAAGPNMLLPGIYDGEESSSIAQRVDRMITLWMPKQTHAVGTTIEHKKISFQVDENSLWIKVAKQRGGLPAGRAWMCRIDFLKNQIAPDAMMNGQLSQEVIKSGYEPVYPMNEGEDELTNY